jgi:hypothetical protein
MYLIDMDGAPEKRGPFKARLTQHGHRYHALRSSRRRKNDCCRELISLLLGPVSYVEGDTFWSFIAKPGSRDRRESSRVIMRAMTAAALPFARSGYDVVIDFSIPPQFLTVARAILKDTPLDYVLLRPSQAVCEARAAGRAQGSIADYTPYRDFYALFVGADRYTIHDDEADVPVVAARIRDGIGSGIFCVS